MSIEMEVVTPDPAEYATPLLAVPVVEGESEAEVTALIAGLAGPYGEPIRRALASGDFKGKEGQAQLLYPVGQSGVERLLLVGLGAREKVSGERIRRAVGTAVKQAGRVSAERMTIIVREGGSERLTWEGVGRASAEAVELASFVFDEYRTGPNDDEPKPTRLAHANLLARPDADVDALRRGVSIGAIFGRAENLARRLGNLPGNVATPTYLAGVAEEIAGRFGMSLTVLGPAELEAEGMHALLAVSRGSEQEPRLIVIEHRKGNGGKPLVLVGKGLTFDSGGISIKPAQSMEEMKFDMSGGGAVLGAMQAIGEMDLPIDVVGVIPSTENLISGRALKPGDIIRTHLGKTVEVVNTDAEGRLILADALSYARRFDPAAVVDAATLTGACVVALGHQASAVLGTDDTLIAELRAAGDVVGERLWPMPLFDEYREQIKSDYADIKNSGGRPAGAITAAWFLREFVGDAPWAHLDIAGTAYGDGKLSYQAKGSTGAPTRLFIEWVRSRVA